MFDREHARAIRNEISSYNPGLEYRVENGRLIVRPARAITPEQDALIREHKELLIQLFTTSPDIPGPCYRGHYPIAWTLNPYGVWICGQCEQGLQSGRVEDAIVVLSPAPAKATARPAMRDYWLQHKKVG